MTATEKYLETFFEEKDIPETTFVVDGPSGPNHIPNEVVIENIMIAPDHEQKKIADTLRKIDFYNGDVNDFLKHLAGALAI